MKTPHHKAFEYTYEFVDFNNKRCIARNYIAIVPGVDMPMLIRRWNMALRTSANYTLIGEIPLEKALHTRGLSGTTIASDWQLLDHMQFHSITLSINEL